MTSQKWRINCKRTRDMKWQLGLYSGVQDLDCPRLWVASKRIEGLCRDTKGIRRVQDFLLGVHHSAGTLRSPCYLKTTI